eukprot:SAG11_NODE_5645_length_1497_cov_14.694564_1_plen_82_part_00
MPESIGDKAAEGEEAPLEAGAILWFAGANAFLTNEHFFHEPPSPTHSERPCVAGVTFAVAVAALKVGALVAPKMLPKSPYA